MTVPTTIVCLGDSITGACDLALFIKWPQILDLLCAAACGRERVRVLNRGIAGDTTAGMLARLERDVLVNQPAIVVLLAGGNDAGQQVPRATTAANLAEITRRVGAGGARILGLQYHVIVHPEKPEAAWRHLPANNDLLAAAVTAAGGRVADTGAAMAASPLRPAELVGADAVHLNPGGELIYAWEVFSALKQAGWLPTA